MAYRLSEAELHDLLNPRTIIERALVHSFLGLSEERRERSERGAMMREGNDSHRRRTWEINELRRQEQRRQVAHRIVRTMHSPPPHKIRRGEGLDLTPVKFEDESILEAMIE
jgi:hypothetical protein